MIEIVPYTDTWRDEFRHLAVEIRRTLGTLALRVDHIGSTAVPGLPAKDIVDIQVTVSSLNLQDQIVAALTAAGYLWLGHIHGDHLPPGTDARPEDWAKLMFKSSPDRRPTNLHVRVAGNPNQRYPILFRDYLRSHPAAAEAYAEIKRQLARRHPDDMDAYYDIKDPVCDIIMAAAEQWAEATGWSQDGDARLA